MAVDSPQARPRHARPIGISLAPVPYFWSRQALEDFYRAAVDWPVDTVYLGETVCGKRRALRLGEWIELGETLAESGKEVVLSSQILVEADSEVATLERVCDNGRFSVEANDMGAVHRLAGRIPFVAGPHLNIYNAPALSVTTQSGAYRWVPPVELPASTLAALLGARPPGLETELFGFGRLPLAFSARCFTARAHGLSKDDCRFRCQDYPDGLPLHSQEGEALFNINGVQLQSAAPFSVLSEMARVRALGIEYLRILPLANLTGEVLDVFHAVLSGDQAPTDGEARLDGLGLTPRCNGFWHGQAGMGVQ